MSEQEAQYIDKLAESRKERDKWINALDKADKREQKWRDKVKKILETYRSEKEKKSAFNILYSNTDTLSGAIYNSTPKPDIRQRWLDDEDKLASAVSQVLNRSVSFALDNKCFESSIKLTIYDYLLGGRGIPRIRYVPSFTQIAENPLIDEEQQEETETQEQEQQEIESYEELAWEQVIVEHVHYADFRMGEGKEWSEIPWTAYRHFFEKDEFKERFGEEATNHIEWDKRQDSEGNQADSQEVWEIWCKDEKMVYWVTKDYKYLLDSKPPSLSFVNFYPIPEPAYAFVDPDSTVPVPLYAVYEQQAEELNNVSKRINTIIDAIKVRGIYDATMAELGRLLNGNELDLIPVQNLSSIIDKGNIDNVIWFMDIKPIAEILGGLYAQREQCKQVIYEIIGLSDILRGSSQASESATAQNIKAQWGGQRVGRMQRDIQVMIRDVVRMMVEVIGEKFSIETLAAMTGLKLATQQDIAMLMQQYQQQAQAALMQGQQPPPKPELPITWEQVKEVLSSDVQRAFKIDIETDSTIIASQNSDMQGLRDLLMGLSQLMTSYAPFVQAGVMPVEAVKELTMAVIRRAKLGSAVEDAFDKISEPPPKPPEPNPEQLKAQAEQQKATLQVQSEQQKTQAQMQIEQMRLQTDVEIKRMELEQQAILERERMQVDLQIAQMQLIDRQTQVDVRMGNV